MARIGAHVSAEGGLDRMMTRAIELGVDCLQVFVGSPQTWAEPTHSTEAVSAFRAALAASQIDPLFVHTPYLVNLASVREDVRQKSLRKLVRQLEWAGKLGAVGVVLHLGSGGDAGPAEALAGLRTVLGEYSGPAAIILENDAGTGQRIGRRFAEIGDVIRNLESDPRLLLCLDTAHALAAGYEVRTPDGLDEALGELDREVGLGRLVLVHANDSKVDLGSNRDRHENIGHGTIGSEAFRRILHHPALAALPFVLEVPGFDGEGPDRENVDALRALAESIAEPAANSGDEADRN